MLSSVLRSPGAVEVNIATMRTFVQLRRLMDSNRGLARKIEAMEKRYDEQFAVVFDAIKRLIACWATPWVEAEDMPNIAANSLSIAFGNFQRGYTIVDCIGVRFLLDPFTNKPYVRLYTYKRVSGDVNDFNAIKLLKFST